MKPRTIYCKVASSRLSRLVAHFRIFRLFLKGKFDAYVLWPLAKRVQNWIVNTACNFTVYPFFKAFISFYVKLLSIINLRWSIVLVMDCLSFFLSSFLNSGGAKTPLDPHLPTALLLKMPLKSEMQTVHDFESEEFCLACILINTYNGM